MYCGHVCLSVRGRMPTLLHGPRCNLGSGRDTPSYALLGRFAISARVALLWQHYGNAWQSPTHAGEDTSLVTRLLRAPFHFVHTAGVLQCEREMLASTRLYSLYA